MASNGKYVIEVVDGKVVEANPYNPMPGVEGAGVGAWITLGILGVLLLIALFGTLFIVKQQSVKVIERLGKFKKIATAGLHWKIPFIDRIVSKLDLRIKEMSENVTVKSSDNAFLKVPVKVQYQIIPEKAKEAFYTLADSDQQISSYIVNIVRATATTLDMEEIFKSKDKFETAVQESLNNQFGEYGFKIVNVLVDDPVPSEEVAIAFNRVIASKRMKEAAVNEAEAIRVKKVAEAQAEAESLTLKATAYVQQRKAIAEGMAEVLKNKNDRTLEYLVGIDWRDTVRDAADKGQVILIPTPFDGTEIANTIAALKTVGK